MQGTPMIVPQGPPCENLNHRRSDAPIGHCPQCGDVLNPRIRRSGCSDAVHAIARRGRSVFCIHCGQRLIAAR